MKPSELAQILNVHANTIRKWSTDFADFLSPDGVGGEGRTRDFNDFDVRVIAHVDRLKRRGMTPDDIRATLFHLRLNEWVGLPHLKEDSLAPQARFPVVPEAAYDRVLDAERRQYLREIELLNGRIAELAAANEKAQAQRSADNAQIQALLREIGDLKEQLGELRGRLEARSPTLIDRLRGKSE